MKIDLDLIKFHKQTGKYSCVPMSVECVLKLIGLLPGNEFPLQENESYHWQSDWIKKGFTYRYQNSEVKFDRKFMLKDLGLPDSRGEIFMNEYFDNLFSTIDEELENNRLVIFTLDSGKDWHNWIAYEKVDDKLYKTLTYHFEQTGPIIIEQNLREKIGAIKGTDILTYNWKM